MASKEDTDALERMRELREQSAEIYRKMGEIA